MQVEITIHKAVFLRVN